MRSSRERRGVVMTLGINSGEPASLARLVLDRFRPEYLGLLGSPETDEAGVKERILKEIVPALGLPLRHIKHESWEPIRIKEGPPRPAW